MKREIPVVSICRTTAASALAIALSTGCATPEREATFAIDTLPTGTVVVTNESRGVWGGGEGWRLVEDLRIGDLDGDGPEVFGRVGDVAVDEAGRIYAFDGQAQELRVFDADGSFLRIVGRRGEGPGEFSEVSGMEWGPNGNLWVVDPPNARVSLFDTAGTYVTQHRIDAIHSWPWSGGFDAAGRFYTPGFDPEEGAFQLILLGYDEEMQPADTIQYPQYPGEPNYFEQSSETHRMRAGVPHSGGVTGYLVSHTDQYWFAVTDEYRIIVRTLGGDTLRVITKAYEPAPVTAAEVDSVVEQLEWFTRQGGRLDLSKIPDFKPALSSLFVDDAGRPWVFPILADPAANVLDVFDGAGVYLGRVDLPAPLAGSPRPVAIGDYIYGVSRDDLDVNYVVRFRIVRD